MMVKDAVVHATADVHVERFVTRNRWRVNGYLVRDVASGECALLDPGDDAARLIAAVRAAGGVLRHLLFTHAHHDHVGAAAAVSAAFGIPCNLHRLDERLLRHAPMYALRFAGTRLDPPRPHVTFDDAPDLPLGALRIEVHHTPGHTPGSVCYGIGGVVFTGDTLLREGIGRTDLPGGDRAALCRSIEGLLEKLSPETVLLPGHGESWNAAEAGRWWRSAGAFQQVCRGAHPVVARQAPGTGGGAG